MDRMQGDAGKDVFYIELNQSGQPVHGSADIAQGIVDESSSDGDSRKSLPTSELKKIFHWVQK